MYTVLLVIKKHLSPSTTLPRLLFLLSPMIFPLLSPRAKSNMCWRRDRFPTSVFSGFPCGSAGEESSCNAGDLGPIPGLGRSPGEGNGYPLQFSGLENSMDSIAHGVAKSWTGLSGFHFHFSESVSLVSVTGLSAVFETLSFSLCLVHCFTWL